MFSQILKGASNNLLRDPVAVLGGARCLAYPLDMSRSLRSVRLALGPLATVFRGAQLPTSVQLPTMACFRHSRTCDITGATGCRKQEGSGLAALFHDE